MKKIFLIFTGLLSFNGFSQACTGTMAEMTLKNITATSTTIEYDVYIKNTGTATAKLGGINGNVLYIPGLLTATATGTLTIIEQPNSPSCSFPTLATITNIVHTPASQQMRYTQTIQNHASGNTVDMPIGTDMKFARFRFTSSEPFALTSVTLRLPNGEDGPSITRNIGTLYCNGNTNSTNFAGTLGTMTVGGPYVVNLSTLSNNEVEFKTNVYVYPNPSNGVFNLEVDEAIDYEMYNLLGSKLKQGKILDNVSQLDLSSFESGIYLLKVIDTNKKSKTIKLIKD